MGHGDATPLIAPDDSRISSWYTESADFDYQQGMPNNASVHGSDFGGQLYRNGPGMKFDPWAQINIADASCLTVNLPAGKVASFIHTSDLTFTHVPHIRNVVVESSIIGHGKSDRLVQFRHGMVRTG